MNTIKNIAQTAGTKFILSAERVELDEIEELLTGRTENCFAH